MKNMIHKILMFLLRLKPYSHPILVERKFVSYAEGEKLVREGWVLDTEHEDRNPCIGWVYLGKPATSPQVSAPKRGEG